MPENSEAAHHELMGGALHVYKRVDSKYWQCATFINGFNHRILDQGSRVSPQAKDIAEDWYLTLQGKLLKGELQDRKKFANEKKFGFAAEQFLREYTVLTQGQRSPIYVEGHAPPARKSHLLPVLRTDGPLGNLPRQRCRIIACIAAKRRSQFIWKSPPRTKHDASGNRVSPPGSQNRHPPRLARTLPDLSEPYRSSGENLAPRVVFARGIQTALRGHARARARTRRSSDTNGNANSFTTSCCSWPTPACGPTRPARLQFRDVKIVEDDATAKPSLRSRCAASAASAIARACRARCAVQAA